MILSLLLSVILVLLGVLHFLWGLGIWFPVKNETALVRSFIGASGVTRMPGAIPCFLIAGALVLMALAVWLPGVLSKVVLWAGGFVFLFRGLLTYTKRWRKLTQQEPFATNDRRYFGPLCLCIAGAIIFVNVGS